MLIQSAAPQEAAQSELGIPQPPFDSLTFIGNIGTTKYFVADSMVRFLQMSE
jgi:hypothetical protein